MPMFSHQVCEMVGAFDIVSSLSASGGGGNCPFCTPGSAAYELFTCLLAYSSGDDVKYRMLATAILQFF